MTHPSATRPLPEDAYALAARYDLGAPLAQYRRPLKKGDLVFCSIVLLAGSILIFISYGRANVIDLQIIAQAITGFALGLLIRDLIYHRPRVLVCEAGLVWRKGRKQEVVRWEEVESVVYGPAPELSSLSAVLKPASALEPICKLRRTDGAELTCKIGRAETKRLGEAVARASLPYMLPRAMESYNRGATVSFGPLAVGQNGISSGQRFLPWNQYRGYLLTEGALTIWEPGGEPWVRLPLRQIPNLLILTDLLDEIRQYQRQGVIS